MSPEERVVIDRKETGVDVLKDGVVVEHFNYLADDYALNAAENCRWRLINSLKSEDRENNS